jgi:ferredoxin--NADP+ reductase
MCGGCRVTVGGVTRFACIDGPFFEGQTIDFDEAEARKAMYAEEERIACELAGTRVAV